MKFSGGGLTHCVNGIGLHEQIHTQNSSMISIQHTYTPNSKALHASPSTVERVTQTGWDHIEGSIKWPCPRPDSCFLWGSWRLAWKTALTEEMARCLPRQRPCYSNLRTWVLFLEPGVGEKNWLHKAVLWLSYMHGCTCLSALFLA